MTRAGYKTPLAVTFSAWLLIGCQYLLYDAEMDDDAEALQCGK